MELQKGNDKAWDKRIKEQHESNMTIVKKMMGQFADVLNKRPINITKRKIENTTKEEEEKLEEQGEGENMSIEDGRTKLRRKVVVTQDALEALEIKQKKEKEKVGVGMETRKLRIPTYKNLK